MVEIPFALELAGHALGALGAVLIFFEFFQLPDYIEYDSEYNDYTIDISPMEVREYTSVGRIGAFVMAVGFALQFLATLLTH
ncbi:hypothetical protein ACFFQF_15720 [Haladaptatus pallidirubidus]|uniref:Uncharacterized protein n=1 Tax=Haladaptatus pallidirubidus TaxID=1008152 RepID=A0AAV3UBS6_9EURY|nr:hypothetical protein [Haladaptatus pallidirubidus]